MNNKSNEIKIEETIDYELEVLIDLLQKKEEIARYRKIEEQIEKNETLHILISQIKEKQKELVHFEYYEKPNAYQNTLKELNKFNQLLDENISIQAYKDSLWQANEIVQMLFEQIQDAVVKRKKNN